MNQVISRTALLLLLVPSAAWPAGQAQPPQAPPGKVYFSVKGTGIAFLRPKEWKAEQTKRDQLLTIPIPGDKGAAVMHFYAENYRLTTDDWQQTQVVLAQSMKRSVERQWQEDVQGVPLMLTKTTGIDKKGRQDVALTGLLYSATVGKMMFRLTCAASDFDEANAALHEALQSLRTTDGSKVIADDPNRKLTASELEAKPTAPLPVTVLGPASKPAKLVKGPVTVAGKAGGKSASIRMPAGWTATAQKDGSWVLTTKGAPALSMTLLSTLDSDPPKTAVLKQTGLSLDSFTSVDDRHEADDVTNRAGAVSDTVWRTGKSTKGALTTFDAAIISGDFYVLLHLSLNGTVSLEQRKLIAEFVSGTTIDPTP